MRRRSAGKHRAPVAKLSLNIGVMEISFESNLRAWERSLTDVEKRQLPFATAKALTDTARMDVKPAVERHIEIVFDSPTPFTKKGVAYKPAYKNRPVASVFIKDIQAGYLTIQKTGGVRRPKGRALAIPARQRVNKYGNLPRGTVKRLLARSDTFSGRVNGQGGIWQRKKRGLKLLVAWEDRAVYAPRFRFDEVARKAAEMHFPRRFAYALEAALRTAK